MRKLIVVAALLASTTAFAKKKDDRPDTMSIAVGAGMTIPSSPLSIDVGSVRLRLTDEITVEPSITYASDKATQTVKIDKESTKREATSSDAGLDALVRYTFKENGPVDLQILGGLGYYKSSSEDDPDGKYNNTTTEASLASLDVGVGVETFFKGHYSVSADAITRMYYTLNSEEYSEAGEVTTTTEASGFALPLDPGFRIMFHIYL